MKIIFIAIVLALLSATHAQAQDKRLRADWMRNSTNESGFNVERGQAQSGPFARIGGTATGIITYTDTGLMAATQYCYRVNAFNLIGESGYSNIACATTPATLAIVKAGTGSGVVTAAGINCGPTCSAEIQANAVLSLIATPDVGSVFAGWAGAPDCSDGNVTMNANISCTATFNLAPPPVAPSQLILTIVDSTGKPITIVIPGAVGP